MIIFSAIVTFSVMAKHARRVNHLGSHSDTSPKLELIFMIIFSAIVTFSVMAEHDRRVTHLGSHSDTSPL